MAPIYDLLKDQRLPILMWLDGLEEGAMKQARNLANLPFLHKHVAIMPDSHQGYGMPIGGVIATEGVVIPNAVGVDIGCGMLAAKTEISSLTQADLCTILHKVSKVVPTGFKHHKYAKGIADMPTMPALKGGVVSAEYMSAMKQVGTLGGGNHFIEFQQGSDGHLWVMIHSGSRNLGYKVAKYYNEVAVELNRKWHTSIPEKWELAFLPWDTQEALNYVDEMKFCVQFAKKSREHMMKSVLTAVRTVVATGDVDFIDVAHNYATMENHYGKNVMVHRKGATRARKGELCVIPGSQGTSSYIAVGLGNPRSFQSCSHGAGRIMGRKQAKRDLNLEEEQKKLNDQGILHSIISEDQLDEAVGSYKDIDVVMDNQKDLVEIKVKLKPLAVIKG